jgi:hypothetical protein
MCHMVTPGMRHIITKGAYTVYVLIRRIAYGIWRKINRRFQYNVIK